MRTRTPLLRSSLLAATALGAGALLALAAPLAASAHVTVSPDQADPGSYTVLDVKVPTESDTASTVKVVLDLPTDHPLLSVRYVPVPGWTAELTQEKLPKPVTAGDDTITEAVTKVTWTADAGGGTPPGALQILPLSIGPVPDTGKVRFAAHQYYSDGTVVDWADASESGEHPAPTLYITDAPPSDGHGSHDAAEVSTTAAAATTAADSSDTVARVLGGLGLLVGAAGVIVAALALRRRSAER